MNWIQFLLFDIFLGSLFLSGVMIYGWMDFKRPRSVNRFMYAGEVLLLGAGWIVGLLMILSLVKLYTAAYLWGAVLSSYLFLFNRRCRTDVIAFIQATLKIRLAHVAFFLILGVFIFRNCYFLIDVDSLSTYLFTQRLWVDAGTSLVGGPLHDSRIFVTQFDAVPYSLGLSVFPTETLFPQMVNLLWRVILVLLVFGYTAYRINLWSAVSAVLLVVLNDHFFYSGANKYVILNSAVGAFLFAAAANFWESRESKDQKLFVLGIVFLTQLIINKYYAAYIGVFIFVYAFLMQTEPKKIMGEVFCNKKNRIVLGGAIIFMCIWFLKNLIITGNPVFPVFAGKLKTFGWTPEQGEFFMKFVGGLKAPKTLKYFSFLLIWPGIVAAKYVLIAILSFPLLTCRSKPLTEEQRKANLFFGYWVATSTLMLFSLCLASWQDPRSYRFLIGVFAFTSVLFLRMVLENAFHIKNEFIKGVIILCLAIPGYSIIYSGQVMRDIPTIQENIGVLLNKIQMKDIIAKHYPDLEKQKHALEKNKEKIQASAWATIVNTSAFFLPDLPRIIWVSSTIRWGDYDSKELVLKRLQSLGIKWVIIASKEDGLQFVPVSEYVSTMSLYNRKPNKTLYDYGFPAELTRIVW
ncbi:hypothetical protein ACFL49_01870 [Candidatus Omnitrophota bacterium]